MDSLGEQGLARAGLAKQYNWDVRLRRERSQLQTAPHGVITGSKVFEPQLGRPFLHRFLLLDALTQLPNRFKCIFNQRSATDNDVCVALHSNTQRQSLS